MCVYCQMSIEFRERGPFSAEAAKRISIVHICNDRCTHGRDDFPHDYPVERTPQPEPTYDAEGWPQ